MVGMTDDPEIRKGRIRTASFAEPPKVPAALADRLDDEQRSYLQRLEDEAAGFQKGSGEYGKRIAAMKLFIERLEEVAAVAKPPAVVNMPTPEKVSGPGNAQQPRSSGIVRSGEVGSLDDVYIGWGDPDAPLELKSSDSQEVATLRQQLAAGQMDAAVQTWQSLDRGQRHELMLADETALAVLEKALENIGGPS